MKTWERGRLYTRYTYSTQVSPHFLLMKTPIIPIRSFSEHQSQRSKSIKQWWHLVRHKFYYYAALQVCFRVIFWLSLSSHYHHGIILISSAGSGNSNIIITNETRNYSRYLHGIFVFLALDYCWLQDPHIQRYESNIQAHEVPRACTPNFHFFNP